MNNVTPLTQHRSGPSRTTAATGRVEWVCALTALTVVLSIPAWAQAQEIGGALTLEEARALARASSPEITAAAAAVEAAAGRERQAGAFPNPVLAYGREQTSPGGVTSAQDIIAIEQLLEVGGQRGARMAAARLRHQAAEARLAAAAAALDFEVARAYAEALAADRRAEVATMAAEQFGQATVVMTHRLTAGDVSGYANRDSGSRAAVTRHSPPKRASSSGGRGPGWPHCSVRRPIPWSPPSRLWMHRRAQS